MADTIDPSVEKILAQREAYAAGLIVWAGISARDAAFKAAAAYPMKLVTIPNIELDPGSTNRRWIYLPTTDLLLTSTRGVNVGVDGSSEPGEWSPWGSIYRGVQFSRAHSEMFARLVAQPTRQVSADSPEAQEAM